jgi:hypothetical protein
MVAMAMKNDVVASAAKIAAHAAFDPFWKLEGMGRQDAYVWLARQMGMTRNQCHIGLFDVGQCQKVIEICQRRRVTGAVRE